MTTAEWTKIRSEHNTMSRMCEEPTSTVVICIGYTRKSVTETYRLNIVDVHSSTKDYPVIYHF